MKGSAAGPSPGVRRTIAGPARAVGTGVPTDPPPLKDTMKNALIAVAFLIGAAGAHAQATTAVKEAGKATAETAKQGAENTKAAVSSEPTKTAHKAKASTHKAKAKKAGHESKEAAKAAVK